jgi:hypothetical protein
MNGVGLREDRSAVEARIPAIPVAPEYCKNLRLVMRAIFSSSLRVRHINLYYLSHALARG